jgi:restriction endonuclease S subunit
MKERLDVGFYNPKYFEIVEEMHKLAKNPKLKLDIVEALFDSKEELKITGGATPLGATYLEEGIQFIRVQNVRRNELILNDVKYIPRFIHDGMLKRSQLKEEDVLLTITGMTYGFSAVVPNDLGEANMNQHSVRMRFDREKILPKYVSYFLNSKLGRIQTDRWVTGSSRPALDYETVKQIYILYSSNKDTQKEIVAKVDTLIDKAKQHKERYNELIDNLNYIYLSEINIKLPKKEDTVFTTHSINGRMDAKYSSPFLTGLKELIKAKPHKELKKLLKVADPQSIVFASDYKLIELEDIDEDIGEVSNIETVLDLGSSKVVLKEGQIVVSQLQPESAKIFIVDEKADKCLGSGELVPLEIISNDATPEYLWCILRSPYVLKQWEYATTGSTRERIGKTELYETLIPLPDKPKQKEIVDRITAIIKKAKEERQQYRENVRLAEKTFIDYITD